MGGKRPDQVDLKNQDAATNRVRAKGRQNIPPKVPNPLVEKVRAAEQERQQHPQEDQSPDD